MADSSTPNPGNTANPAEQPHDFSILDLPDEELAKHGSFEAFAAAHPAVAAGAKPGNGTPAADGPGAGEGTTDANKGPAGEGGGEENAAADAAAAAKQPGQAGAPGQLESTQGVAGEGTKAPSQEAKAEPDAGEKPPVVAPGSDAIDYKAEYEKLTAPFKANGKDISVRSTEEAIQLMQMGAGYAKRMAALKPNLAIVKMLEKNGLLDESKLSFIIDAVVKKDPGAINKLIKESGLDPMGLDPEKASDYKPGSHAVDAREIDLDAVMDELESTPTFNRTITLVTKEWDAKSRAAIADQPQLLKVINAHMASGVYDLIAAEMAREEALGKLAGLSSLDAYKQIGDAIQARGGFDHLGRQETKKPDTPPVEVTPKSQSNQDEEDKRNAKKRAAGASRPSAPTAAPTNVNPLAMSDDEFQKWAAANGGRFA